MTYCEQAPKPAVLLSAIRAIGYSFETAVADIIDNSISAQAKNIRIFSEPSGEPYFAFLDDGTGMTKDELRNALLLGSDRSEKCDAPMELGRFGLGLKSASFSQCRCFTVVTKQGAAINAMSFSLDDVEASGTWRTAILDKSELKKVPEVGRLLQYEHGTLVVWRDFDRLRVNTTNFETSFRRLVKMAKSHVEYVFHRFYDEIGICFNEERVEKRDPFLLDSYGMQQEGRGVSVEVDGHKIHITPYSLPYANALSQDERKLLGNPKSIYDEQGLYLYRNRRLIAWGSWFRTEVRSELNKLARVKVDIPSSLDEIWMLDVKKSSAKIPDKIRDSIRIAVGDSVSRSRGAVSKPSEREAMAEHKVWIRELKGVNSVEYVINRENPTYNALRSSLSGDELALFEQFVDDVQDYLPKHQIHIDQAGDLVISNGEEKDANISAKMADLIRKLRIVEDESDRQHMLDRYLTFESYRCLKPHKAAILEERVMTDDERKQFLEDAKEVALIHLKRRPPTHSDVVAKMRSCLEEFVPDYTQAELSRLVTEIEYNIRIKTQEPDILVDATNQTNWFMVAEPNTKKNYFERYVRYLRTQGFPEAVISQMESDTRRVLALSANPLAQKDSKRGLVVGDVQSGKTANYLALINLACDFGYKIIVLLAGMTDSLREQTQDRVDLGFIGAMSDSIGGGVEYVGVGLDKNEHYAVPLTNTRQDFVKWIKQNINATPSEYTKPLVLVVKKNKGVLGHVHNWLKSKRIRNQNILIVDDEADNASINSKRDDNDPTQINRKIRELFTSFDVATYVGFTATPFANIFINPTDDEALKTLFPADFIVQLKTPSNYCGAHWFFDSEHENTRLRLLDETEEHFLPAVHKRDAVFTGVPESMKEAVLVFLLGCAVRTMRGQEGKHRSMLINISRFNDLQWEIQRKVVAFIEELQNIIEQETYKDIDAYLQHPMLKRMFDLYETKPLFAKARAEFSFNSMRQAIRVESGLFRVVVLNNKVKQDSRFSYKDCPNGARVIAIGGFLLSRGLTLEGLMVSYYSRNTATYDSLLQMGRWFGYRFGYEGLCVLYISRINVANFRAVISAVDDLKEQFAEMRAANKSPRDFGLMVKCSPDTLETALLVTSRNKMFHSQRVDYWLSYGGTVADTSKLYKDPAKNAANKAKSVAFLDELAREGFGFVSMGSRQVVRDVSKKHIAKFIAALDIHFENRKFDTATLSTYIVDSKVFPRWDVTIATGSDGQMPWRVGGHEFPSAIRKCEIRREEDFIRVGMGNNRLIEPGIFSAGLTDEQLREIKARKRKDLTYSDYLNVDGRNPLLVLYPLSLRSGEERVNETPYIGFAVGFPARGRSERTAYQANEVKLREMLETIDILDEDEENGEEP